MRQFSKPSERVTVGLTASDGPDNVTHMGNKKKEPPESTEGSRRPWWGVWR